MGGGYKMFCLGPAWSVRESASTLPQNFVSVITKTPKAGSPLKGKLCPLLPEFNSITDGTPPAMTPSTPWELIVEDGFVGNSLFPTAPHPRHLWLNLMVYSRLKS